jgi:hypothetical protein
VANNFGVLTSSFYTFGPGLVYIGLLAVAVNIAIAVVGSLIANAAGVKNSKEAAPADPPTQN